MWIRLIHMEVPGNILRRIESYNRYYNANLMFFIVRLCRVESFDWYYNANLLFFSVVFF